MPAIATVADENDVLEPSVNVTPESMVTGVEAVLSPATNAAEPESVTICGGPSTSTVSVAAALVFSPSFDVNTMVRLPGVLVLEAENFTAESALAHCVSFAVPPDDVSVSTPVAASYEPTMLPNCGELVFVNESVSPL